MYVFLNFIFKALWLQQKNTVKYIKCAQWKYGSKMVEPIRNAPVFFKKAVDPRATQAQPDLTQTDLSITAQSKMVVNLNRV